MSARPGWPWLIAALFVAAELAALAFGPYGWFIDELYYRACALRLDWGYVDHPPLSVALLAASRAAFGDSLLAMRLIVAVAAGAAALTSSRLARRMGGGDFALALAALCTAASPGALIMGSFFSMNALELLLWPTLALAFFGALERGGRGWLLVGMLLGVAILDKHTSATFGLALGLGMLLTPARTQLRTRWPWLGGLIAVLIVLPNVVWQITHGWPSLEFYAEAQRQKNIDTPALQVLASQALVAGPIALPLALLGAAGLARDRTHAASRSLAAAFVLLLAALMLSHSSRPDRLLAAYPILFAAGAVAVERATSQRWRWGRALLVGLLLSSAALVVPITLPLLSPTTVQAYAARTGILPQLEKGAKASLPQWFADRLGWPELAAEVARVTQTLPPADRAQSVLFAPNYGEAGALELWGPALGLPPVLSNHNTYYLWSDAYLRAHATPGAAPQIVIALGVSRENLEHWFSHVDVVSQLGCEYCTPWRRTRLISVARGPREPLLRLWPRVKHFE